MTSVDTSVDQAAGAAPVASAADAALLGFAATVTDDLALARHAVTQAVERAREAGTPAERREAARVWVARAALSQDWTLGRPVAADVDVPVDGSTGPDDLAARWSRSSRLQRVVAALHFGEHLDAAAIARVVGSTEADITAYLRGVRDRLRIASADDELAVRRLLADHAAGVGVEVGAGIDAELAVLRERVDGADAAARRARDEADEARARAAEDERRRAAQAEQQAAALARAEQQAAERLAEQTARAEARLAEAQAALAAARAEFDEHLAQQRRAAAEQLADAQAQAAAAQAALAAAEQQRAADLAAADDLRLAEVAAAEQQRVAELAAAEDQRVRDLDAAAQQHAAELAAAEDARAAEVAAAERRRDEDLEAAEQQRAADLAVAEQQRAADLAAAEQQRAAEVAAAEQQRSADLAAAEQQRAADLAAAEQQRAADLAAAEERRERELAALDEQRRTELTALEQAVAAGEAQAATLRSDLGTARADVEAALSAVEARTAELSREVAEVRAEVDQQLAASRRAADERLAAARAAADQRLAEALAARDAEHRASLDAAARDAAALREQQHRDEQEHRAALEQAEARTDEAEARAQESEARAQESQARAQESEARAQESEARADEAQARAEEAQARAEEAQSRADEARARADALAVPLADTDDTASADISAADTTAADTDTDDTDTDDAAASATVDATAEAAPEIEAAPEQVAGDAAPAVHAAVNGHAPAGDALTGEVLPARSALDDEIDAMFELSVRKPPPYPSLKVVRPLIVLTAVLGLNYLVWRWIFSVHWSAWFIAVPLVIAETYSLIDSLIFGFTMWRLQRRPDPGPPPPDATVDVFITTYNEPLDLVMKTAHAAQRITFPHTLWILDDGNRPELREVAGAQGIGVISRSSDWIDMPRHAKAGNLNNALMVTQGEFIVILDADQVPAPELLDRTLGYFREDKMAVVQTPQFFVNVPRSDPLGSQAPLFYGPIQQGKDGWNSAFFCGSNAVLRREALLQMGIRRYVHELQVRIEDALNTSEKVIKRARAALPSDQKAVGKALASVLDAARDARAEVAAKEPLADVTARFQRRVHEAARRVVEQDLAESRADLNELFELVDEQIAEVTSTDVQGEALDRLARRDWSPLGAIETVAALIAVVDVDREDEAQPIMPMSTISVTEDMATCMRMHSMGWKSAYHDEVLAVGLAPEDLGTMLTQRLRWAQGTIQVMLRENPLRQKGLSWPQKIMYLGTMWSYLSGFAALAYIAAPCIYLVFGVLPVQALSVSFFSRLIPFLIVNQLLFFVIGRGRQTWRGQQYSLALFPVWIKAVTSAVSNVVFGRSLTFAVTPKERVRVEKLPWRLVRPQLIAMGLLVGAAGIGILRLVAGQATVLGTTINLVWVAFDLVLFSAVIRALFYKGFEPPHRPSAPAHSPAPAGATTLQEVTR